MSDRSLGKRVGKAATVGTIWAILLAIFSIVYLRQQNKQDG